MAEVLVSSCSSQSSLLLVDHHNLALRTKTSIGNTLSLRLKPISIRQFQLNNHHHHHHLPSRIVVASAASDPKAPFDDESAAKDINIQTDSSGGEGGGSIIGGGGGGGGSGDDYIEGGEGGPEPDDEGKKISMSMSQKLTLAYAALVGVGGVMGFLKSGSQKSLLAGGISAAILYYVYTLLPTNPTFGSSLGLGVSAALLGVMGSRYKKSRKIFPPGVVSLVSLVMTGGYLHGIMRGMH